MRRVILAALASLATGVGSDTHRLLNPGSIFCRGCRASARSRAS